MVTPPNSSCPRSCEHGQAAVDKLIREVGLDQAFGFEPGTLFNGGLAVKDKYSKGDR